MIKIQYRSFFQYDGYCYECKFYLADSTTPGEGFCNNGNGTVDSTYSCSHFSR